MKTWKEVSPRNGMPIDEDASTNSRDITNKKLRLVEGRNEKLIDDLSWAVVELDSEAKNNMSPAMKKIRKIIEKAIEKLE
jgi:hypothetical protein